MLNIILRAMTFVLLLIRGGYWSITAQRAKKEKPSEGHTFSLQSFGGWVFSYILEGIVLLQLIGVFTILPMGTNRGIEISGSIVVILGIGLSFWARHDIGVNWSHAADYEIKKDHTLVTKGIYAFIRHPIYLGLALSWIGAEMVAGSYLYISFFALFVAFYFQGKREEKILRAHFGNEYKEYMKKTKMLIPFVL